MSLSVPVFIIVGCLNPGLGTCLFLTPHECFIGALRVQQMRRMEQPPPCQMRWERAFNIKWA